MEKYTSFNEVGTGVHNVQARRLDRQEGTDQK